jgi:carnitine 3-dehydrogenase
MSQSLAEVDLVQENAPERPDFKFKLFAEMDRAVPPDAILASSSSSIMPSSGILLGPVSTFHSQ